MTYLVFDSDEELIDIVQFNSDEELNKYKSKNPKYHLKISDDFLIIDDDSFLDYDDIEW